MLNLLLLILWPGSGGAAPLPDPWVPLDRRGQLRTSGEELGSLRSSGSATGALRTTGDLRGRLRPDANS